MSGSPDARKNVLYSLSQALPDYEEDEDRPEGDMDTAEMGVCTDPAGEQMEVETEGSRSLASHKERSLTEMQQHNSSEESLTVKAREFIAKNKSRNLGGGGNDKFFLPKKQPSGGPSSLPRSIVSEHFS